MPSAPKVNPSLQRKHAARIAAVQCLYARMIDVSCSPQTLVTWHMEQAQADDAEGFSSVMPDKKLLQGIVFGISEARTALEEKLSALLGERWISKRMPLLMKALLQAALYELIYTPSLKTRIILDQYVGVADAFLDESDVGFVNGVLQEISQAVRPAATSEGHA
jgi:transcription antitermination protein NusB